MSLFKKNKKDDYDETLLIEEEIIKMTPLDATRPKPNVLTADEIEGKDEKHFEAPSENPLEALRRKMMERNSSEVEKKEEIKESESFSHFSINTSFLDEETQEKEEPSIKKGEKIILTPEEVKGEDKADIKDKEIKGQEDSLLQNCLPFIMDGQEGDTLPEEKPSYKLESVASILGIEEDEITEEEEKEEVPEAFEETIIFKALEASNMPDISDIDTQAKTASNTNFTFTGTMPVVIADEMIGNTRDVDISDEFFQNKQTPDPRFNDIPSLEDEEDFEVEDEYRSYDDRKRIRKQLLTIRRNSFLKFSGTIFSLVILLIFFLPVFSDMMLAYSPVIAIFTSLCVMFALCCNYDVMSSLLTVFSKRSSIEAPIALSAIFSSLGIIFSFINKSPAQLPFSLGMVTVVSLFFRSFFVLRKSQYIYNNFALISTNSDKYGIELIDDAPTTFAMARKAIDGDVLIAAPRRTKNIGDFIKNSYCDKDFDGNAKYFFFIALALSLVAGLAFGLYRSNYMIGIICACIFSSIFAPLTSLALNIMPLCAAASHLNRYGGVLTGLKAARQIEEANAVVFDCNDIFPKGTIRLADMKILSENNVEETIACACAITATIKSPLAPIFKAAMATNKDVKVPVADSIKYEEKLGITGWVGDKRVFIGNRTLMIAHEIPVPDAETDKKLMREGYFPVYLACDGRALALFVLRYIPDANIAKELDRLSAMGLTLLINNCDQNISEEMICDYFDLYSDSVKIMSGSGVHMYKTAVNYTENMNTGAAIKSGAAAMAATVYAANRVKRAVSVLQVIHIISIVIGIILFAYATFGSANYISPLFLVLYQLICFVISYIAYLFTKP